MKHGSMIRGMVAGFVASLAMAFFGFFAKYFGAPFLDWAKTLGQYFGGNTLIGYFAFFVAGIILAVLYVAIFHDRLPGTSWKRGIFYAVLMWLVTGVVFAPIMQMGFFMGSVMMAVGTLVIYMMWGAIMGLIYEA